MHVIGTAGHVDHGKSTLVRALTGIDPDRLAEEKEREMTIDLGFAWFTLGDEEIGIVDVPGHRDFIENMLAGVGGIDLALLVIAADEGIMPQTREHLAILDLLGVESGIIALTKTDLIEDPEWIDLITLDVAEALSGSTLADAPIVPVSARTGEGLSDLRDSLTELLANTDQRLDVGQARLPIDRVFTVAGFGTIVTGTLLDGSFHIGDSVEIAPDGLAARIRGLQTHKTKREVAVPGSRVAINLTGVDRDALRRGQVVTTPGSLRPTLLVDVAYRHLVDAGKPLKHNAEVKLFIGSAEVSGRARVLGQESIEPGHSGWVQLSLSAPVTVTRGDRFILRRPSPGATIGGGTVLDSNPRRRHRRFRPEILAHFEALQAGTPEEIIMRTLHQSGPIQVAQLLERSGLSTGEGIAILEQLSNDGEIKQLDRYVVAIIAWRIYADRATAMVTEYHQTFPLRTGISREELRNRLQLSPSVFGPLITNLIDEQRLAESGAVLKLPDHRITFSAEQQQRIDRLMSMLREAGVNSSNPKVCKEIVSEPVYAVLVEKGDLIQISPDVVYATDEYQRILTALKDYLVSHGEITAAQTRDLLGTSRKYAIALLEHLDELKITRRVGDARVLLPAKSA
ncbi:MAG: selenocysteine-specific translation elongation factor [Chloroflexota bacterium]